MSELIGQEQINNIATHIIEDVSSDVHAFLQSYQDMISVEEADRRNHYMEKVRGASLP